jgi:hypothetical protein
MTAPKYSLSPAEARRKLAAAIKRRDTLARDGDAEAAVRAVYEARQLVIRTACVDIVDRLLAARYRLMLQQNTVKLLLDRLSYEGKDPTYERAVRILNAPLGEPNADDPRLADWRQAIKALVTDADAKLPGGEPYAGTS